MEQRLVRQSRALMSELEESGGSSDGGTLDKAIEACIQLWDCVVPVLRICTLAECPHSRPSRRGRDGTLL